MTIFGTLLVLSGVTNRIWESSTIMSATFAFAACVVYLTVGVLVALGGQEPLRQGEPAVDLSPRAVPAASLGAVVLGLGAGALAAGFVFGSALVIAACGMLAAGILLLTRELHAQRRALVRERRS